MTAVSPCSEIPSNPVSLFITGSPVAVFSFTVSPFWSRAVVRHEFQIAPFLDARRLLTGPSMGNTGPSMGNESPALAAHVKPAESPAEIQVKSSPRRNDVRSIGKIPGLPGTNRATAEVDHVSQKGRLRNHPDADA